MDVFWDAESFAWQILSDVSEKLTGDDHPDDGSSKLL
jgi:hypothetical protein